jgi:alpha-beta hydrolase superfamily lysophospholipase
MMSNGKCQMNCIFRSQIILLALFLTTISCNTENNKVATSRVSPSLNKTSLIKHTVLSDGHPMAVWEKRTDTPKGLILLVHGQTWSSVPDFDLQVEGEDLSLMDGMLGQGYTVYAVDLRGYGGTPRDSTQWATPLVAANDILNILSWISEQNSNNKVHLFGWSMGSTLTLLATQINTDNIASLTLFGFWKDLDLTIPEDPADFQLRKQVNTNEDAASDFITPGSISDNAINTYVKMALESDPVLVDWRNESEYNRIDPSLITTPVLLIQGEYDPQAPTDVQAKLFTRLKTADKTWIVISGGDHAAFMETPREDFISSFSGFISRFN